MRDYKGAPDDIRLSSQIGELVISFERNDRIRVNGHQLDTNGHAKSAIVHDGQEYDFEALLIPCPDGPRPFQTARTDHGNEAGHGLDLTVWGGSDHRHAPKKVKDAIREILLDAVCAFLASRPELLIEARAAHLNNQIVRTEQEIEKLKKALLQLETKRIKLIDEEALANTAQSKGRR